MVCVMVVVGPLLLSMLTHDMDRMVFVPVAIAAAGIVALIVLLLSGRRAEALVATALVAAGMYFFLIADDANNIYDNRCARALGVLVPPEDRLTARFIAYEKHSLSFEYYARVRTEKIPEADSALLIGAFSEKRRIYALLDDDEDWDLVKKSVGDRAYLIGKHREMYLVSNRPAKK
jgi:hypothetical protein